MPADSQKLIAYGKVLEDDNKTLKDYSIKEGDFLVVMVSKVGQLLSCSALNQA
jgi:Ubiquitin family